jgi:C1q domain
MKSFFLILLTFLFVVSSPAQIIKAIRPAVAAPSTACCGFTAYNSTEIPMGATFGKENVIVFDKERFDDANAFQGVYYKAPSNGVYQFNLTIGLSIQNTAANTSQILCTIKTSATQSANKIINVPANYSKTNVDNFSAIFKLKADEEVSVTLISLGAETKGTTFGNSTVFSGVKLY